MNPGTPRSPVKRLKLLLIDRDLELQDLAMATGLSISLVKKISSGSKTPSGRAINRIESAFGCRIFSIPREYRERHKKKLRTGLIEIFDAPFSQNESATASIAVIQEPTL